ncbi:TPA: ATP-binding protein [Streptococcus pneumoniae]
MLDWKQFFLAYLRSRSRLFIYLLSLAFLVLLFQFLFASLGIYFLYFFFLCCFVTILFFTWDILVETQVYRQELLYGEREAKSPLEIALAEKLEAREMELYQQRSKAERKLTDLLDYYTLWVHQIKTPIAASQLKQVQIEDLVKEIIRKYALFFIQKGLNVNLHDLDKEIVTDKKWLLVVIEQIISNSLKYTKEGGLEIYMDDQELCIKDTGIGIKNSDVLRVFERGFSGYNGRLTQQSSGLGLYLSKKISEELGHQIRIESEVGKGTTVRIQFAQVNLVLE